MASATQIQPTQPMQTSEAERVRDSAGRRLLNSLFLLALGVLSAGIHAQQSGSSKIGYVDLKRLIDNAPQMISSRERLQREFAPRDSALKADEKRLKQLQTRYTRNSAIMSKADSDALKRKIDTLQRSVKRSREQLRQDYNAKATSERDRIWQQINNVVIDYARSQGFDLIVPSPVVYASPRIDITDAVLERLRQSQAKANKQR